MSNYAHLSKPDPEFAAFLEKSAQHEAPPEPTADIAAAQKGWIEHSQVPYATHEKSLLHPGQ
jgi:hypothetical protein